LLAFDREQLVRVADLVHAVDHRAQEREHSGDEPEAEPDRHDAGRSRER
jgi:hypothetical protein